MKIALVSQEYPPQTARGGIGTQTYMKARGLSARGHEVYVISRSIDMERHEKMDGDICVIRIPGMEDKFSGMTETMQWLTHSIVVAQELEALNKKRSLDIIDFPEWAAEGYAYLLNRVAWNKVPVVIQLHGPLVMFAHTMGWPEMNTSFYKTGTQMEATVIQLADAIYSSSECSAQWIRKYYYSEVENIPIIHLGVDTTLFAPQTGSKKERPTIIFTGKIVPNKGVEELVKACSDLVHEFPRLQLRMIGSGDPAYIKQLVEKADDMDGSWLDLPGFIGKEALPTELASAHIFAAPSWYEGGPGFVFLEAMACGLPVIGCSGSGIDEVVTHGENGLLVPAKNSKALKEAIREILNDKDLMKTMGTNARKYVLKEADCRLCLQKLESFYVDVLKTHALQNS